MFLTNAGKITLLWKRKIVTSKLENQTKTFGLVHKHVCLLSIYLVIVLTLIDIFCQRVLIVMVIPPFN